MILQIRIKPKLEIVQIVMASVMGMPTPGAYDSDRTRQHIVHFRQIPPCSGVAVSILYTQ